MKLVYDENVRNIYFSIESHCSQDVFENCKSRILAGLKFNKVYLIKIFKTWPSLAVQWLGPGAFTAMALGSVPGWGSKILQATWCGQKRKKVKTLCLKSIHYEAK